MRSTVFFRKAAPIEAALHQKSMERMFGNSDPLPDGVGTAYILGFDPFGTLAAASEMTFSAGVAHIRFGMCPSYRDSDVDESLLARTMLSARNCGAKKIVFTFSPQDEHRAQIARKNGMCVDRSGSKWVAQADLAHADPFSFGIECLLSFFFPVPAECR